MISSGSGDWNVNAHKALSLEQYFKFSKQRRRLALNNVPRLGVIDLPVSVDEDVAKADDGLPVGDPLSRRRVDLAKLR